MNNPLSDTPTALPSTVSLDGEGKGELKSPANAAGSDHHPGQFLLKLRSEQAHGWKTGKRVLVEDYLAEHPFLLKDRDAVLDLIYSEILLREEAGELVRLEEYLERFPQHSESIEKQMVLHQALESESVVATGDLGEGESRKGEFITETLPQTPLLKAEREQFPVLPGLEIHGLLGRGGMGVVYKAWQIKLKRWVAVKMILAGGYAGQDELRRFGGEARFVARLQHPNIVQIHEIGELDGLPYFALEFVEGGSLAEKLRAGPISVSRAAELIEALARAVHYAHECNIIHRDLKPGNVLLTRSGTPKITDFGLAKRLDNEASKTQSGAVMGTPSYMAPEQALGQTRLIGPSADVYALGAMLYELLTGRPPFRADTAAETIRQLVVGDPISPRRLQPTIPRDLETICLKCLHRDLSRRYESARTLADDLARFRAGQFIQARPIGWMERASKWVKRQPVVAALIGIVFLVTLVGMIGIVYQWRQAELARRQESNRAKNEAEQRRLVEQQLYFNRIAFASREVDGHKIPWAKEQLSLCPHSLRNWEWFYLDNRCRGEGEKVLTGHGRGLSCVAASPDGILVASASGDGTVRLWEAATGNSVGTLRGHNSSINWVAFNHDGKLLASAGEDGQVILWQVAKQAQQHVFTEHQGAVSCVAFHPQSNLVASATFAGDTPGEVLLWDGETCKIHARLQGHSSRVSGLAFHPNGGTLVTASHDQTARLWDIETGKALLIFTAHHRPLASVAFSPDGRWIASAGGRFQADQPEEGEILLWDSESGDVRRRLRGHAGRPVAAAFSPDCQRVATGGWDQIIKLWDTASGQELVELAGHRGPIMTLAFTSDGHTLISGALDHTLRLWNGKPMP